MILQASLIVVLALGTAAREVAVPCRSGKSPCGNSCIPSSIACCELTASSLGTIRTACPVNPKCDSDRTCHPPGRAGSLPSWPVCPEGLAPCGLRCISPAEICCNNGENSCPKELACAPAPVNCVSLEDGESSASQPEPYATPTTTSSRERTLLTPGDQERPTTAPDYTLPELPSYGTATPGEPGQTGDESSQLEAPINTLESSDASSPATATSAVETTSSTVAETSEPPSPSESEPAEDRAAPVRPSVAWAWAAPMLVALLFV